MTSSFATPLHFAVHLLAVFVALGVALTVAREPEGGAPRFAAVTGFIVLAVAESIHTGAFAGDLDTIPVVLRTVAYVLLIGTWLLARPPEMAAVAFVSGQAIGPAAAAALASAGALWRSGDRLAFGGGLGLLAVSEAFIGGTAGWADTVGHAVRAGGFLLLGSFVLQAARRSIRFRFMAGFVSLLLIVVLVISVAVSQVIERNVRAGALDRLRAQAADTSNRLQELAQDRSVALVALVESLVAAILEGREVPEERVVEIKESLLPGVDFIIFLDEASREIGTEGVAPGTANEIAGTPVVQFCLSREIDAVSLTTLGERDLALIGCSVLKHGAELAAVGVAGFYVDDDFLVRLTPPGGRAAAFRGAHPVPVAVNGPFPGVASRAPFLPADRLELTLERFLAGGAGEEAEVSIGNQRYFTAFAPLKRSDGQRIEGILMVAEPARVALITTQEVIRLIFLVTLGVILIALFLALLAARRITRPVEALTQAARQVQRGDLATKADVAGQDEVGDLARAFNQMTDSVTEATGKLRAAAEEEARLRDRLETVVNSMGDGLIAVGQEGSVTTYNPAAAAIVGLSDERVMGRPVEDVLRARDPDGEPVDIDRDLPPGVVLLARTDGGDIPVAITSSQLRDASGLILGRVYVLRDMSREHQVERMKTEFLSNVSHELRTPLTPIIGYSEIMARRGVPTERGQEFAGAILDSARRLERIVAMLVDFSAMEGGRMTIEAQPTSLRKLVKGTLDEWRERTDRHRFVTTFAQELPEALGDVSLLRRALDELIDNAVKYSPNGGNIRVSVSSPNSRARRILKVDVEDEGIGIEERDLATIFEDFHQVDASDTRTYGGLGLGLAFVRRIIEAHRGDISAVSRPGAGTRFSFTLPAVDTSDQGGNTS